MKKSLTAERLRELFDYDPETGALTRRAFVGRGTRIGDVVGGRGRDGYLRVSVDGHDYLVHRLAWLHVHGRWPAHFIDHVNGVGADNRLSNLREASQAENLQNTGIRATNKSGVPGVYWDSARQKWKAQITHNYKNHALGRFDVLEDAGLAYLEAKARLHTFNPEVRVS